MWKKTLFTVVKMVLLQFLIFSIKPLEATRPLDDKNTSNVAKKMTFQENIAAVPPSGPNPCTYIPGPGNGHCNK